MVIEPIESLGYKVWFEDRLDSLDAFIRKGQYSRVLILVDRNTEIHCLPVFQELLPALTDYDIIEIDPGEENKNIDFCIGIWKMMLDFGADRKCLLVNLGGGVVTDMGGFAASTFKRGIDFVQVPTTLLAQVDASVGGKTGIDMDGIKNIIGTFSQPRAVFISSLFLKTLDQRQQRSGMAEMIKHGLIRDADFYFEIRHMAPESLSAGRIRHSVELKNQVVLEDPFELGLRKILNFGHTIGHALETFSLQEDPDPLLHGEAIAAGMICEAYLSHKLLGLSQSELENISETLISRFGKVGLTSNAYPALLEIMSNDKKNTSGKLGFALLDRIGHCEAECYVEPEMIIEGLDYYRNLSV